jgi:hypothetical protein
MGIAQVPEKPQLLHFTVVSAEVAMRAFPAVLSLALVCCSLPAFASSPDDKPIDAQTIAALEARAALATPREQCFLYAQLVHEMIEFSAHQYAAGEFEQAALLLKRAQDITRKIHVAVTADDKKLKDAQILLRHTAFRLSELIHSAGGDDRALMSETLTQLNAAQTETMLAVFKK